VPDQDEPVDIARLLVETGLAAHTREACRLLAIGAVRINGAFVTERLGRVRQYDLIRVGRTHVAIALQTDCQGVSDG